MSNEMDNDMSIDPMSVDNVDAALQQAVIHHRAGQLQDAERLYRAILQMQPQQPDANHNLGVIAVQVNQPAVGLPHFKIALEVNPTQLQYWLSYIDALLLAGKTEMARQVLTHGRQQGLQGEAVDALAARVMPHKVAFKSRAEEIAALTNLFESGRLAEFEALARQMTQLYSREGIGWKALGVALLHQGHYERAIDPLRTAADILVDDVEVHANFGAALQALGRVIEAESSFRQALKIAPNFADAQFNLGACLHAQGRNSEAAACLGIALERKANFAEAYCMLGVIYQADGRHSDAEIHYLHALRIKPDFVEAHCNLGAALHDLGQHSAAEISCRRAIALRPNFSQGHSNLGSVLLSQGRLEEAEASCRQALHIAPNFVDAHCTLAAIFLNIGRLVEAESHCRLAIQCQPKFATAHGNLGAVLQAQDRLTEAELSYRHALQLNPESAEILNNLSAALQGQGKLTQAEAACRKALQLKPDFENAYSNLLFILNYDPDKDAEEIYSAYFAYDLRFGSSREFVESKHVNDRNGQRRLKIGYVSPDFRQHSVRHFLEPLLAHHDKKIFEVFAYAELNYEDVVSIRYKNYVDHWIVTTGLSDAQMSEHIQADGIDILVDLAGHTAHNRLQVFARKPAPVSVSWLGFGYTTGLKAIDYFLTDQASAPAGSEEFFSEMPWRLDRTCFVYRPAEDMGHVSPLPAQTKGYVTFGSLTRATRINRRTIQVWSDILKRVPNSRLVIDSSSFKDVAMQTALAKKFVEHGIEEDRLEIGCHSPPWDVLRGIDIGLDCFPHNSGTTLFETLYMGVPYITLASRPSVGRLGSTVLEGVGHPEWIADTEQAYIMKAVALAQDQPKLSLLRAGLRREMELSSLMDEVDFCRKLERAYREMFERWANARMAGS